MVGDLPLQYKLTLSDKPCLLHVGLPHAVQQCCPQIFDLTQMVQNEKWQPRHDKICPEDVRAYMNPNFDMQALNLDSMGQPSMYTSTLPC